LFGLAYQEVEWKGWCKSHDCKLIVDAAQAPFAHDNDVLAGTAADLGVYSLNVHKHIQCGEGGIVVTHDDALAASVRRFINHGELAGGRLGLNLRMTEVVAAIALVQLRRAEELIESRIEQAEQLLAAIGDVPGLVPQFVPHGCKHVYYTLAFTYDGDRSAFVAALQAEGVPLTEGYAPIHRLRAFRSNALCPIAAELHDRTLFYFENCAYSPTREQIAQIGEAFRKVAEHADRRALHRA
jgi:dTDP-4-amino-4,6-dideoxygalactose transaminase